MGLHSRWLAGDDEWVAEISLKLNWAAGDRRQILQRPHISKQIRPAVRRNAIAAYADADSGTAVGAPLEVPVVAIRAHACSKGCL